VSRPSRLVAVELEVPDLDAARMRARERRGRIVAAGRSLMQDSAGVDFTMQAVAERARTSLRAVYEHFSNKDDFLLAVFEHAIVESAEPLRDAVAEHDTPVDQLRAYVERLFHATFDDEHPEVHAMIGLHLRLAHENPAALATILTPQNDILLDILRDGVADGSFRNDIEIGSLAMMVSQTIIAVLHTNALGRHLVGSKLRPDVVWRFCLSAVERTAGERSPSR
jgi:AcrR family transcriptional regulator